jgi:hypothetical protein
VKVPTSTARVAPMERTIISIRTAWSSPICIPDAGPVRSAVTSCSSCWSASGPVECRAEYSSMARSVNRLRLRASTSAIAAS